jgi:hypothetical protein
VTNADVLLSFSLSSKCEFIWKKFIRGMINLDYWKLLLNR